MAVKRCSTANLPSLINGSGDSFSHNLNSVNQFSGNLERDLSSKWKSICQFGHTNHMAHDGPTSKPKIIALDLNISFEHFWHWINGTNVMAVKRYSTTTPPFNQCSLIFYLRVWIVQFHMHFVALWKPYLMKCSRLVIAYLLFHFWRKSVGLASWNELVLMANSECSWSN